MPFSIQSDVTVTEKLLFVIEISFVAEVTLSMVMSVIVTHITHHLEISEMASY